MSEDEKPPNVEDILNKYIPPEKRQLVKSLIHGRDLVELKLPHEALELGSQHHFDVKGYQFGAAMEELRKPNLVTIGVVQNSIVLPTNAKIVEQRQAIQERVEKFVDAAAHCGVNILCLQETWPLPFVFATRDKLKWTDFAEDAEKGPSTQFCAKLARKYNMVIVSPILERDESGGDVFWNTAVVISNSGKVIGKTRKTHIPKFGDSNESNFYMESTLGHSVFKTTFGNIGVDICFGRHHPQNWMMYGVNGADIVFNPCATRGSANQNIWLGEARTAAIANNFFTCGINRVGLEQFDGYESNVNYFGTSYIAGPDGSRTPALSSTNEGLLVAKLDLNLCQQSKDHWGFRMSQRLDYYATALSRVDDERRKTVVKL